MSRDHIRVIDDYRHCHENEFFFTLSIQEKLQEQSS